MKYLVIKDLRSDKRIDFVGGIRGLGGTKKRVDSGEMKVALALYPLFNETTNGYCRYRQHYAAEDNLV